MDKLLPVALFVLAGCVLPPKASAEIGATVDSQIVAASDYVFRGVSQTMSRPTAQGSVDAAHDSGFYGGVWVSGVDFVADGMPDDGARLEVDLTLGYEYEIDENWSADFSLVHYAYPGTESGVNYDYSEIFASLSWRGAVSALVGWSDDTFGEGAAGVAYELAGNVELGHGMALSAIYGHYDLSKVYDDSYSYYSVGLSKAVGAVTATVSFHGTDSAAGEIFGSDITSSRAAFGVSVDF